MSDNWDGVGERYGTQRREADSRGWAIGAKDAEILRELARRKKEAAAHPRNSRNRELWRATNDLAMRTPPVFIDEVCWHEVDLEGVTRPRCEDPSAARLERAMRRELFLWENMPASMIVSDFIECPMAVYDSGFGLEESVDVRSTDPANDVVSRHFHIQLESPEDIAKLKSPVIEHDEARTLRRFSVLQEAFRDTIDVRIVGTKGLWFTPWDYLIRLTGVEEAMMNLILEPEFIDALVERYVDLAMERMERYNALGLWASNNTSVRVGSGGYGITSDLPEGGSLLTDAPTKALWGCGNAQIFSEVSPGMHWDFSLRHELRWLSQFGLCYYGCCEPLDGKLDILNRVPNLRKISMSPWANLGRAAEAAGKRYVLSCKPNPAVFAAPVWNPVEARKDLLRILDETRGCNIEIVMKDISTVRNDPTRLFEWAKLAMEVTGQSGSL